MPKKDLDFEAEADFKEIYDYFGRMGAGGGKGSRKDEERMHKATELAEELIRATPRKTGETSHDWHIVQGHPIVVRNDNPRIHWLEFGVAEHLIRAKNADDGMLRFRGRDGSWMATAVVSHPGMRALGFVRSITRAFFEDNRAYRGLISVVIYDDVKIA